MRYSNKANLLTLPEYKGPNGSIIETNHTVSDLGILMSDNLSFKDHINKVQRNSSKYCSWILRTFKTRNKETMKLLWTTYVQPHIDYCSQLWAPTKIGDLNTIEKLQQEFTRKISEISHLDYWERLKYLNMYSQERRFERYVIIYIWKAIEGIVTNFGIIPYHSTRHGRLCRVPPIINRSNPNIKTLRENSIKTRGPKLFNSLPPTIRNMSNCSTESFKYKVDSYLKHIPDQPRIPNYTRFCNASSNSIIDMKSFSEDHLSSPSDSLNHGGVFDLA